MDADDILMTIYLSCLAVLLIAFTFFASAQMYQGMFRPSCEYYTVYQYENDKVPIECAKEYSL